MTYCSSLTDTQVKNVLIDEANRINGIEDRTSKVREAAEDLYFEAREELAKRGINANIVLFEAGVNKPKR